MKKIIIIIILFIVLITSILGYIIWNNRIVSIINLDINPSIEIQLDNHSKVKKIITYTDSSDIINTNLKDKTLNDCINIISNNLIEKGYIKENFVNILLYTKGKIKSNEVLDIIREKFDKHSIATDIIIIDKITKEDKKLADKYNISVSKAAYINSILKDNDINVSEIKDKSINELKNTKERGLYCNKDYFLDGDRCLKEIKRIPASRGDVCPDEYMEYNGKCYHEVGAISGTKYICHEGFELTNDNCVGTTIYKAYYKCDNDEEMRDGYCIYKKYVADAYEFCRDPGRTLYDHKCLATKPSINGGCLNGDMYLNGKCVNTRDDYYLAEWKCPNGEVLSGADGSLKNNDTKCYEEIKGKEVTYYCNDNDDLIGTDCQRIDIEKPRLETYCPTGYSMIDDGRCINYNDTKEKIYGYFCEDNTNRLDKDICIIYEDIEPNK